MNLARTRHQWERLGRQDPLWAVLTRPDKRNQQWDPDEFFATGREEIDSVLGLAGRFGLPLGRHRALDFGCGVGRLTQALARQFHMCDGVDISASMLAWANGYNRAPEKCRYHLNDSPDLKLFADGSFSFVYSHLVLQHIPPDGTRAYIREFLRVLESGGLLVFHLPSHQFPGEADSTLASTSSTGPLAESAFRAEVVPSDRALAADPGQPLVIKVLVQNKSDASWPALGGPNGAFQVRLAGRWLDESGRVLPYPENRSALPHDVTAGDAIEVFVSIQVPRRPGRYWLELDMIQEETGWFSEFGSTAARLECLAGPQREPSVVSKTNFVRNQRARFSRRHPRLHGFCRAIGLISLVRLLRRARAQWQAFEAARYLPSNAVMDMNGIPKAEITDILRQSGGLLLTAEPMEMTRAGWQSYRYWVTKSDSEIALDQGTGWRKPLQARIDATAPLGAPRLRPGSSVSVPLRLTNAGGMTWVAATLARRGAVFLGAHAYDDEGQLVRWDFLRQPLPANVQPGATVCVDCSLRAPEQPGAYVLRVDLVMEGVCWFETHGCPPVEIKLEVTAETPDSRTPGLLMAAIAIEGDVRVLHVSPGSSVQLAVRVANQGNTLWLDRPSPDGGHVGLGGHLYGPARDLLTLDLLRAWLPGPVAPGETVDLRCDFRAPELPGRYFVELDMVDEGIAWFGARGSPTIEIQLDCH